MMSERTLHGKSGIDAVSELLLNLRGEDVMAGLWDASDMQWWWVADDSERINTTMWTDDGGRDVAYLIVFGGPDDENLAGESKIAVDLGWLPSADGYVREELVPSMLTRIQGLPASEGAPVRMAADDRDADVCRRLEDIGFRHAEESDLMVMAREAGSAGLVVALPSPFRFDDDRTRSQKAPHPLAKRNGEQVAERLRQCSLYRQDLDLCIRDGDVTVAAYCLCWLDERNGVGVFEPVRTEDAYQRRGLGRALLEEGVRRLTEAGARTIKVARRANEEAPARLYRGVGFVDVFRERAYVRIS